LTGRPGRYASKDYGGFDEWDVRRQSGTGHRRGDRHRARCAQLFAREGAKVVVSTARNVAGGNETVKLIEDAGGEAIFVQCDVSKEDQVRAMVERCVEVYGRLDYAFNNAGVGPDGRRIPLYDIVDMPEEIWDQTLDTNLKGVFLCIKYEFKQMIKQGGAAPS
jgi:NAD(P)-dependent dehydrogenase (short-subunit alcohol dehydrogenase family)